MCDTCVCSGSALVADAAQAFEAISELRVLKASAALSQLSERLRQPDAIQVKKGAQNELHMGRLH